MTREELNSFKIMLESQLESLLAQSGQAVSEMLAQNMTEIEYLDQVALHTDQVLRLRIKSRESHLMKKILTALDRIENDTFGTCEICGEEISFRRLMARPVATKCILCKTEEERLERMTG